MKFVFDQRLLVKNAAEIARISISGKRESYCLQQEFYQTEKKEKLMSFIM